MPEGSQGESWVLSLAKEHGTRYGTELPRPELCQDLRVGDMAKLVLVAAYDIAKTYGELLWVEIFLRQVTDEGVSYRGRLANAPVIVSAKVGDVVHFGPEHVVEVELR